MSDAKELREAIALLRGEMSAWGSADYRAALRKTIAAAEARLATLPREVTVEGWAVVEANGKWSSVHDRQEQAERCLGRPGQQVVRLVGPALLPGSKE